MTDDASATDHLPPGYTSLTPFFCVDGAAAAIEFYTEVFGGHVVSRIDGPNGTVAHCEIQLASGRMQLSDPAPDHHLVAPTGEEDVSRSTVIYVSDVDATYARAVARGAKGYGDPETFVTGDRYATILDPWGHRWAIMTRVVEVDSAEAERRVKAWLEEQS